MADEAKTPDEEKVPETSTAPKAPTETQAKEKSSTSLKETPATNETAPIQTDSPQTSTSKTTNGGGGSQIDEKSTKLAFLKQFRGLRMKDKGKGGDKSGETTVMTAAATEQAYKQIVRMKGGDYWIVRIKKRTILFLIGLVVLVMWLVPAGKWAWSTYGGTVSFSNGKIIIEHQLTAEEMGQTTPTPTPIGPHVRIRNTLSTDMLAQELEALLAKQSILNVEIVPDQESSISGVAVVVKANNETLRAQLEAAIQDMFRVTSPSAELTQDSDFDAVIFVGNNATVSAVPKK